VTNLGETVDENFFLSYASYKFFTVVNVFYTDDLFLFYLFHLCFIAAQANILSSNGLWLNISVLSLILFESGPLSCSIL
jgi:hypothetical protein